MPSDGGGGGRKGRSDGDADDEDDEDDDIRRGGEGWRKMKFCLFCRIASLIRSVLLVSLVAMDNISHCVSEKRRFFKKKLAFLNKNFGRSPSDFWRNLVFLFGHFFSLSSASDTTEFSKRNAYSR